MEKFKNPDKTKAAAVIIPLYIFVRALFSVPESLSGIGDSVRPGRNALVFYVLLLIFSLLFSLAIRKLFDRSDGGLLIPLVLIAVSPELFFCCGSAVEVSCYVLFAAFLVLILTDGRFLNRYTVALFVFVFAFLTPLSLFTFVPASLTVYFLKNKKENKPLSLLVFAAVLFFCFVLRSVAAENTSLFMILGSPEILKKSSSVFSAGETVNTVVLILTAVLIILFFAGYYSCIKRDAGRTKKRDKKEEVRYFYYAAVVILSFAVCLTGRIISENNAFTSIVPLMAFTALAEDGESFAGKVLSRINRAAAGCPSVFVIALIVLTMLNRYNSDFYMHITNFFTE